MPIISGSVARAKPTSDDLRSVVLAKADATSRLEMPKSSNQRQSSARKGRPVPVVSVPTGTYRENDNFFCCGCGNCAHSCTTTKYVLSRSMVLVVSLKILKMVQIWQLGCAFNEQRPRTPPRDSDLVQHSLVLANRVCMGLRVPLGKSLIPAVATGESLAILLPGSYSTHVSGSRTICRSTDRIDFHQYRWWNRKMS